MLLIDQCRLTWPDFSADYSLKVEDGALCALIGSSGGGKTTLLHLIAGFETPQSGTLTFRGSDLLPLQPSQRPVAIVFQDHNLFPHLSVARNVALGLRPSLRLEKAEWALVSEMLEAVGLTGYDHRKPGEMSGGQRQRVALARAMVSKRPIILLDEPFSSLDPQLRRSMIQLVDELRKRQSITVIMSIHTPEEVADVAEQMVLIDHGRVIQAGSPPEVLRTFHSRSSTAPDLPV
ncbi:thiamine ABC transporter ATP-binding protein [Microvirga rosea]|uniref:thiamine ABC transporter ATP-binding protein n=1 Tax=Microvirga rosea TaxID=2715425 RepID=UPI001D09EDAC|nr:ATP-binding cassette domain-containing protein [Microvirga rosea]MCB8822562.1 ATP-binding cassette domain-containing protein [Microvirga rosea]